MKKVTSPVRKVTSPTKTTFASEKKPVLSSSPSKKSLQTEQSIVKKSTKPTSQDLTDAIRNINNKSPALSTAGQAKETSLLQTTFISKNSGSGTSTVGDLSPSELKTRLLVKEKEIEDLKSLLHKERQRNTSWNSVQSIIKDEQEKAAKQIEDIKKSRDIEVAQIVEKIKNENMEMKKKLKAYLELEKGRGSVRAQLNESIQETELILDQEGTEKVKKTGFNRKAYAAFTEESPQKGELKSIPSQEGDSTSTSIRSGNETQLEKELTTKSEELKKAQEEIKRLKDQIAKCTNDITNLQSEISQANINFSQKSKELTEATKKIETLNSSLKEEKEAKEKALKEIQDLSKKIKDQENTSKTKSTPSKNNSSEGSSKPQQSDSSTKSDYSKKELEALKASFEKISEEFKVSKKENENLNDELQKLKGQNLQVIRDKNSMQEKVEKLTLKLEEVESSLSKSDLEKKELKLTIEDLNKKIHEHSHDRGSPINNKSHVSGSSMVSESLRESLRDSLKFKAKELSQEGSQPKKLYSAMVAESFKHSNTMSLFDSPLGDDDDEDN